MRNRLQKIQTFITLHYIIYYNYYRVRILTSHDTEESKNSPESPHLGSKVLRFIDIAQHGARLHTYTIQTQHAGKITYKHDTYCWFHLTSNERGMSVSACVCLYKYRRVLLLVRWAIMLHTLTLHAHAHSKWGEINSSRSACSAQSTLFREW